MMKLQPLLIYKAGYLETHLRREEAVVPVTQVVELKVI